MTRAPPTATSELLRNFIPAAAVLGAVTIGAWIVEVLR